MLFSSLKFSFLTGKMEMIIVVSSHNCHEFKWENAYNVYLDTWHRISAYYYCCSYCLWLCLHQMKSLQTQFWIFLQEVGGERIEYTSAKLLDSLALVTFGFLSPLLPGSVLMASAKFTHPAMTRLHSWFPTTLYRYSSLIYLTFTLQDSTQFLGFGTVSLKG